MKSEEVMISTEIVQPAVPADPSKERPQSFVSVTASLAPITKTDEAQRARRELEEAIGTLLWAYMKTTGLSVERLNLHEGFSQTREGVQAEVRL